MDPATLAAFLAFVEAVAPEAIALVGSLITDFKSQHPALSSPPPSDGEAAVNAAIDADIKAQYAK